MAAFESDRGLSEVLSRLAAKSGRAWTAAEVRELVDAGIWRALLKAEGEFRRAGGSTDAGIVRQWNKAGVPTLDGLGKWTQAGLVALLG